jgi:hypothetical protein
MKIVTTFTIAVVVFVLAVVGLARSQNVRIDKGLRKGVTTPEDVKSGLEETSKRTLESYPTAARGSNYVVQWPGSAKEYKALAGYAVVFVTVVTHDANELPVKRVYLSSGNTNIPLSKLYSWTSNVPEDWLTHKVMGSSREDGYYLAPTNLMLKDGAVLIDFAITRTGFKLIQLPMEEPKDVGADLTQPVDLTARPDPAGLKYFISVEFPGFPFPNLE